MLGILTDPIESNRRLDALGTSAIPATTGEALGATWDDALIRNPTASLFRWAGRTFFQPDGARVLSAEDANRDFGLDGALTFKGDTPEPYARDLYEMKRAELRRQDVQARAEGGLMQGAAQLGVGFVAGVIDPLNIASAFLPVVGESRMASLLAGASGAAGRAGVRAAVGAAEGALGAALVEPIVYGVAQQEQADYHAVDSLLNLAFGAGLGGGLHVVGGAVADRLGRWRNPVESRVEEAPFTAREAALRSAVADVAEDRAPAQADLALREVGGADGEAPGRRRVFRRGNPLDKPQAVFDADGQRVMVRYELADADRLVTSHRDDLSINPEFPADLQPRERDRLASHEQIRNIAANLEPERLGLSSDAATGAPIVGGDDVVDSGNGRVLSLRRAAAEFPDNAASYRAFVANLGFDVSRHQNPILIRRRLTDLTAEERTRFTVAAQKSAVLDLSATERAIADARTIDRILPLHEGGDVGLARNAPFVRGFVDSLPQADQGGVLAGDGQLSRDGKRRVENALLARAFDDADLLGRMIETDDDNSRAIAGALLDVAPLWARMRADVAAGRIAPGVDATDDLLEAVRLIRDARASGKPLNHLLSQIDAFRRPSPATELFLDAMLRGKGTASRDAVASALTRYVDEAGKSSPDADLFGTAPPTREDLLRALKRHDPMAPPAEDLDVVAAVDRSLAQASSSSPAKTMDGPRLGDALTAANDAVDADLARLRDLGLIRGDEPEFQHAAALADDAASQQRALDAGAFCLSRRG
ncbi:hypothetical protein [Azospirillum sp.]|uniref:hypothetical protein n=1 Tax=Azospirillum sp. TaxID=34012 RepID=UPI0026090089|nr:hypothetical protein [Azospirillum sp.]